MKPAINAIGTRLYRDGDDMIGTVTSRDGPKYLIKWDDGFEGFVIAEHLEAALVADASAKHAHKHSLKDRARQARASLEAIRSGKSVTNLVDAHHTGKAISGVELSDADRRKILARLRGDGQKTAPPVSPSKREAPATPQQRDDRGAHAASVSRHVRALLASNAKN